MLKVAKQWPRAKGGRVQGITLHVAVSLFSLVLVDHQPWWHRVVAFLSILVTFLLLCAKLSRKNRGCESRCCQIHNPSYHATASYFLHKIGVKCVGLSRPNGIKYSGTQKRDSIQFLGAPKLLCPAYFNSTPMAPKSSAASLFFCIGGNQLEEGKRKGKQKQDFRLPAYIGLKIHCRVLIGCN